MRASWVIVLVAACGGGGVKDIKDTPPPANTSSSCRDAGQKLIELVVTGQNPPPPDDAVNKLISLVEKRCDTDSWSQDARTCFSKVKSVEEADVCSKTLSDQQLANLSGDMAPPKGSPPPPAPGTRGAMPEDEDKGGEGASADPCDGGE
jgi:hypothetical protein